MAADEGIMLFVLPPHTTHVINQCMDNGAFTLWEVERRHKCQHFLARNPGKVITQQNLWDYLAILGKGHVNV